MHTPGKVIWNELNTFDVARAREFYARLFGWSYRTSPMEGGEGDYVVAMQGEEMVAGIFDMATVPELKGLPSHWFTYFAVDDIEKACAEVTEAGGAIRRPPFQIPGGRIAVVADATGAVLGLMEPEGQA